MKAKPKPTKADLAFDRLTKKRLTPKQAARLNDLMDKNPELRDILYKRCLPARLLP
jgi:hypothetical protein